MYSSVIQNPALLMSILTEGEYSCGLFSRENIKADFMGSYGSLHTGAELWCGEKSFRPDFDPCGIPQRNFTVGPMKLFVYSDVAQTRESPKSSQAGQYGRKVDKTRFTAPCPF